MIPYDSFTYFGFLFYPLAVAVIAGLCGVRGTARTWVVLLVSAGMLVFQFMNPLGNAAARLAGLRQLEFLGAYVLDAVAVIVAFLAVRRRVRLQWVYWLAIALTLAPLAAVKFYPLLLAHHLLPHLPALPRVLGGGAAQGASSTSATSKAVISAAASKAAASGAAGSASATSATASGPTHPQPAGLPSGLFDLFGFLGISYMTFRVLDTIILIQDGVVKQLRVPELLSYLIFFPTISAGPIDRYRRFVADLHNAPKTARAYLQHVDKGIYRIVQGFVYKFIVAVLIDRFWMGPAAAKPGWTGLIDYMYAYTFYLFFDFAGYSAFAIGTGHFLGLTVPENFSGPFLARNFREVWNRWHMTLSFWFRDHIYMRFVLGARRRKWFRGNQHAASYVAFMLTMVLMGLWHGPYPHYLVYGFLEGAMLVTYDFLGRWNKRRQLLPVNWFTHVLAIIVTFNVFAFTLLVFSGHWFT